MELNQKLCSWFLCFHFFFPVAPIRTLKCLLGFLKACTVVQHISTRTYNSLPEWKLLLTITMTFTAVFTVTPPSISHSVHLPPLCGRAGWTDKSCSMSQWWIKEGTYFLSPGCHSEDTLPPVPFCFKQGTLSYNCPRWLSCHCNTWDWGWGYTSFTKAGPRPFRTLQVKSNILIFAQQS